MAPREGRGLDQLLDRSLAPSGKTYREWADGLSNLGMQETTAGYGINHGDSELIERPEGTIQQKARPTDEMWVDTMHLGGSWWEAARNSSPRGGA